jgi:hypothetical protein
MKGKKRKILSMDELAANAESVFKGKAVNIACNKETFEQVIKKAATPKQSGVKRPQT